MKGAYGLLALTVIVAGMALQSSQSLGQRSGGNSGARTALLRESDSIPLGTSGGVPTISAAVFSSGGLVGPGGLLVVIGQPIAGLACSTSGPSVCVNAGFVPVAPPFCEGDANGSGVVDFGDVLSVLANWGSSGPGGDANGDGSVNFVDIISALARWGVVCA